MALSPVGMDMKQVERLIGVRPDHASTRAASRRAVVASWIALAGLVVFNVGWFVAGLLEGSDYSAASDYISELSALTARHAWLMLGANGCCGVAIIAFALLGFRPAVAQVKGSVLSTASIVLSALGADTISDVFFRLNCRRADGCTLWQESASWHGAIHVVVGALTILVLLVAPFVVAHCLRRVPAWADVAWWSIVLGVAIDLATIGFMVPETVGYAQRLLLLEGSIWLAILAVRVLRLARGSGDNGLLAAT
jgi:hypothetical protein